MFITFLNLIKKKIKFKNYINLWQYGYTSHVITSSHCKAPKTTSTHSLQNLWWVHMFLTYFFVLSLDIYKKKEKESTVFSEQFSEHSTCKKLNKIKNEISELLIACNVHRKTNYDTILRSLWWFWSVFRFRIESLHMKHKSGTTSDTLLV